MNPNVDSLERAMDRAKSYKTDLEVDKLMSAMTRVVKNCPRFGMWAGIAPQTDAHPLTIPVGLLIIGYLMREAELDEDGKGN